MSRANFVRIEIDGAAGEVLVVRHLGQPGIQVEFLPGRDATGVLQTVTFRRLVLPNLWDGNFHLCRRLLREAERFLWETEAAEAMPFRRASGGVG